jgi:hypothetical protein
VLAASDFKTANTSTGVSADAEFAVSAIITQPNVKNTRNIHVSPKLKTCRAVYKAEVQLWILTYDAHASVKLC